MSLRRSSRVSSPSVGFAPRTSRCVTAVVAALLSVGLELGSAARAAPESAVRNAVALKELSVEQLLQQEVVSVSRHPENWGQVASGVFVVHGESVPYVAATRLPELLRLAPNLFVARADSANWAVGARGFMRSNATANKLLVLVDGRTVYSPFFSNVFWDAQDVFLPDLDRVEVITGPAGSNWGANAVNGVINILSKPAQETLGTTIVAAGGTEEEANFGVRHGTSFGRDGAVRVYAQARRTDATAAANGRDDGRDENVFLQTGFRADWGESLTLQGDAYRLRTSLEPEGPVRAEGGNVLARWRSEIAPGSHVMVKAYHDYAMRDIQQRYVARTHTSDLEFQHRRELDSGNQTLVWGGNYRHISDAVSLTAPDFAILPARLDFALGSLFAQHELRWDDGRWDLTSGLRVEHNHFSGWEMQPNLKLAWRPAEWTTFWASAARATRTPSRLEQGFYAPRDPPHFIAGGPDIDSETLDALELGARWQVRRNISLTTTVYRNEYDDLRSIELTQPIVQANGVAGRSTGAEAFVDWDVSEAWRLRAGGFYVDQRTWIQPGHTDAERALGEASFPEFQFQLRNTFWLTPAWSVWIAARYVDEVPVLQGPGMTHIPAYTEVDANVTWSIRPDLEVSLIGRNLLKSEHAEIGERASSWRQIERSVQAVVRWHF